MAHAPAKFEVATSNGLVGDKMHLQEKTLIALDIKDTRNVAQYPLHYVTYAPAKFEVAKSDG